MQRLKKILNTLGYLHIGTYPVHSQKNDQDGDSRDNFQGGGGTARLVALLILLVKT